ncbi:hypothetical protein [Streptomyces paludis]|uniref:Uncharacterized protein n=1 Tax=Streptomyces paludis TaxID=2282738 RepID=A0A345HLP8_9ACTN|nr:hypothetical protein [Streptomyces paludis]AXG77622.1 hypothetical protein DVK44_07820 [Streptomyces paludis]
MSVNDGPQMNEGIVIGGNAQVSGGSMAAGRNARAVSYQLPGGAADPEALRAALESIAELRRALAAETATPSEALAEAEAAEVDLAATTPDPDRVLGRLERLRALLGSGTALLALVASAQESVRAIVSG